MLRSLHRQLNTHQIAPIILDTPNTQSAITMDSLHEPSQSIYLRLANLMRDDKTLAIFRRFDDVNLMCLLSLQAEIMFLRQKFYVTSHLDNTEGSNDEPLFSANFRKSKEQNSQQYQLLEKLKDKMMVYSELREKFRCNAADGTSLTPYRSNAYPV
jgi:hypothetical protein